MVRRRSSTSNGGDPRPLFHGSRHARDSRRWNGVTVLRTDCTRPRFFAIGMGTKTQVRWRKKQPFEANLFSEGRLPSISIFYQQTYSVSYQTVFLNTSSGMDIAYLNLTTLSLWLNHREDNLGKMRVALGIMAFLAMLSLQVGAAVSVRLVGHGSRRFMK